MTEFAAAIEQIREANQLSQADMASRIKMPATQYNDCIKGRRNFSYRTLKKVEKEFKVRLITAFVNKSYFEEE